MIKISRVINVSIFLLLPLFFGACKNNLVQETTHDYNEKKNAADYDDYILPPGSVSASQGKRRCVVLSWEPVKNAIQYQIYSAETPYSIFSKVSETKDAETEITIDEESGVTKYYCVCAVNYYGTVSAKSVVAKGSVLSVPVITAIEPSEDGNAVDVNWWMDNCAQDTYAGNVVFNINVYSLSAPTIKAQSFVVDGDSRHISIQGLTSKTEYYFEVEVENKESHEKETSGKTSAETARRVIPEAPVGFDVSQGDYTDKIEVTWNLPQGCWYRENSGVSGFVLHPVYFNVFRKLASESDEKFKVVARAYVQPNDEWKYKKTMAANDFEIITATSDKMLAAPYSTYVPEAQVVWEDTTAERGKKYSYYIQSITDDTPEGKTITSDSSCTDIVEGWIISIPSFSINTTYEKSADELEFTKITCDFNVSFEPYGKVYSYVVVREQYKIDDPTVAIEAGKKQWTFNSLDALSEARDVFDSPKTQTGYYTYALYICPEGSSDISGASQSVGASGKYLVTDDVTALPEIEDFVLTDGYNDHFELSWKYNPDYVYTIKWQDVVNQQNQEQQMYEIPASYFEDYFQTNPGVETVTYSHPANSGDRRIYYLEASTGLSESFRPNNDTKDIVYETLGTAQPQIVSYEYDKLCVSWKAVQKAGTEYEVSAKYEDDDSELVITDGESKNIEIENIGTEEEPEFECTITKPEGYNDADWSGKTIKLKVTATSSSQTDTTVSDAINVCTIGPALTEVIVDQNIQAESINIKWTPVAFDNGVDGYLIRRIPYKTTTYTDAQLKNNNDVTYDIYYWNDIDKTLTINGEVVDSSRAEVNLINGYLKLTDKYKEATSNENPYENNQSYIAWGIPFGYMVIPVKHDGSPTDDFTFTGKDVKIKGEEYGYSNIKKKEEFASTSGYGLNVYAEKSESADTQVIRWKEPYIVNPDKSISVYYRNAGDLNNIWKKINYTKGAVSEGQQSASLDFSDKDMILDKTEAYEYLIAYGDKANASQLSQTQNFSGVPLSFINDNGLGLSATDENIYDYTDVTVEKANKGYLFAVKYEANTGSGTGNEQYSEVVSWDEWDYSSRSIGPSSAKIKILNYNISADLISVAELDNKLYFSKSLNPENANVRQDNNAVSIKLWPQIMMDGTLTNPVTKGVLQVLRDAKHYYSIELKRTQKSGEEVSVVLDDGKYAYRNISDLEFAKLVMAEFSNALINIDILNFETKSDGNASFNHQSVMQLGHDYKYIFSDYSSSMLTPAGNFVNSITINCKDGICSRQLSGVGGYPKSFNSVTLNISKEDKNKTIPPCYEGSITFSLSSHDNASITVNRNPSVSITMDSDEKRRIFVPFKLYGDENIYYQNSSYGWWN